VGEANGYLLNRVLPGRLSPVGFLAEANADLSWTPSSTCFGRAVSGRRLPRVHRHDLRAGNRRLRNAQNPAWHSPL